MCPRLARNAHYSRRTPFIGKASEAAGPNTGISMNCDRACSCRMALRGGWVICPRFRFRGSGLGVHALAAAHVHLPRPGSFPGWLVQIPAAIRRSWRRSTRRECISVRRCRHAYIDPGAFPQLAPLAENWETIREECLALTGEGAIKASDGYNDAGFNSFFRTGWKRFYLSWYGTAHQSAMERCPKTMALLQSIPDIKAAMFAMLPPGAHLVRHRDPYAGSLRYHLGLSTPKFRRLLDRGGRPEARLARRRRPDVRRDVYPSRALTTYGQESADPVLRRASAAPTIRWRNWWMSYSAR